MINGRKVIGFFLEGVSGNLQRRICTALYNVAEEHGYNMLFFNFVGIIGSDYKDYAEHEYKMLDVIPFHLLDGAVFDNSNILLPEIRLKIREKLRTCKCPIASIGDPCEDFVQVHFDNSSGIAEMVDHFVEHHGFDRIGFLSGPKHNPDAQKRLEAFRGAMRKHGLPENGVGVFHGDLWYNKGNEAAEFFFEQCEIHPQAIVCANDFMAIAVCDALAAKGISCPEDVCISGFDNVEEANTHTPSITTVKRDETRVASSIIQLFEDYYNGKTLKDEQGNNLHIILPTDNQYSVSCGCKQPGNNAADKDKNAASHKVLSLLYYIFDTEAAMLEMNRVSEIELMKNTFAKYSKNIGSYSKFFLLTYTDEQGKRSYEKAFDKPSKNVYPAVWIDNTGTSIRPNGDISVYDQFIPTDTSEKPYCYYISHLHFGDHAFGYSAIMMDGNQPFNEFYNLWTVNIAISLETLLQRNIVRSLITDLELESTHDRLTSMLNRRGFERETNRIYEKLSSDPEALLTAVMIDMDKLKYINDVFGHKDGDYAISTLGSVILSFCDIDDISGRTGGDEFYIIMPRKDEAYAVGIVEKIRNKLKEIGMNNNKDYEIDISCGIYSAKIKEQNGLEDFLRESDERMYVEKRRKHAQRGN